MPDAPAAQSDASQLVTDAQDRFVAAWGQMSGAWGISRTMAEVHALLYITGRALCTDDVIERLQISRGNGSMSLRALEDWGLVTRLHKRGDRKEYFECESDVWVMFKTIARERKKRELDPVLALLYEIRDLTGVEHRDTERASSVGEDSDTLDQHNTRLDAMLDFLSTFENLAQVLVSSEGAGLRLATSLIEQISSDDK